MLPGYEFVVSGLAYGARGAEVEGANTAELLEVVAPIVRVEDSPTPLPAREALGLLGLTFSGDRLRATRTRVQRVSPIPGVFDPRPNLHMLQGAPETGKTSLALWFAQRWAAGEPAWEGAPALPGSRVLVISREQTVRQIDSLLTRFEGEEGALQGRWEERIHVVARDEDLAKELGPLLMLDAGGLERLTELLAEAEKAGDPFGLVVLDSLSRLKPSTIHENDNNDMSPWLDSLVEIATRFKVYILLLHHTGHEGQFARKNAKSAGRGASAIGAVSVAQLLLTKSRDRQRLLTVDGNFILGGEIAFEVCGENDHANAINYFRPCDRVATYEPTDYLVPGESISTNDLAWRLSGKPPVKGKNPPGASSKLAQELRDQWVAAGNVETFIGTRGAKMIRLRSHLSTSPPPRPDTEAKCRDHLASSPKKAREGEVVEGPWARDKGEDDAFFESDPGEDPN